MTQLLINVFLKKSSHLHEKKICKPMKLHYNKRILLQLMIFFLQSLYLGMIIDDNPRMQRRNLNLVKMNYKIIIND